MHVSRFVIGARGRPGRLSLWMGRALLGAAVSLSAVAGVSAQPAAAVQATSMSFDVPAGALNAAIVRFGRQAGLQFSVDSRLTDKRSTQGIKGRYTAEDGLRTLLTGTGLSFRFTGPRTVVIELPPDADGAKLIGALRIEGAEAGGNGTGGANGSTDATATENTGSYASQGTSVGSKSPESIKSTPQTVSVISSAQIADQKITDLNTAMDYAPGITVQQTNDSQTMAFYARGMEITRVQIDGGAPMDLDSTEFTLSGYKANFDMSLYDHVEILRGVDGLFNGNGYAGGVVNLVRKRPLDHFQAKLDTSLGSWDNYRSVLDVTAPLGWDGALRGRAVATWQKRRYFYDGADDEKKIVYGVLEADVGDNTQVRLGGSYTDEQGAPWYNGLPRYRDGSDLHLPRHTSLMVPWSHSTIYTAEAFAELEHRFSDAWSARLNLSYTDQDNHRQWAHFDGNINQDGSGLTLSASQQASTSEQSLVDGSVSGKFDVFGIPVSLVVGGNYKLSDGHGYAPYPVYYFDAVNVFDFDPGAWAAPVFNASNYSRDVYRETQTGGYAKLVVSPWPWLHLSSGLRYNRYSRRSVQESVYGSYVFTQLAPYSQESFKIPYYAVSYDIAPAWSAYASYTDMYRSQANYLTPQGAPLKPLVGNNKEAGIKYSDNGLEMSLAFYRMVQSDVAQLLYINLDEWLAGNFSCCYANATGTQLSRGIELEASGALTPNWQVSASYAWNSNAYKGSSQGFADGAPLSSFTPHSLFKLWSSYQFHGNAFLDNLRAGGGVKGQSSNFVASSTCTDLACTGYSSYAYTQKFYVVASAFANYQIDARWSLALNLNNLFDRRYYQTMGSSINGNWYGEPRNWMLTLSGEL